MDRVKLAERLPKYHGNILTIGVVITACGTDNLGYFGGGRVMPVKNITTVARATDGLGYCVGVFISK